MNGLSALRSGIKALSIKMPQAVEYARKNMTDHFVINEYFDLLLKIKNELGLHEKPHLIWNLDETSFTTDRSKTKETGKPSSRTVSGPGRDNITVLSAVSASGLKAPPLIIFKGKNAWSEWVADEQSSYIGMHMLPVPMDGLIEIFFLIILRERFSLQLVLRDLRYSFTMYIKAIFKVN